MTSYLQLSRNPYVDTSSSSSSSRKYPRTPRSPRSPKASRYPRPGGGSKRTSSKHHGHGILSSAAAARHHNGGYGGGGGGGRGGKRTANGGGERLPDFMFSSRHHAVDPLASATGGGRTPLSAMLDEDEDGFSDAAAAEDAGEKLYIPHDAFGKLSRIKWDDVLVLMESDLMMELFPILYSIAYCTKCHEAWVYFYGNPTAGGCAADLTDIRDLLVFKGWAFGDTRKDDLCKKCSSSTSRYARSLRAPLKHRTATPGGFSVPSMTPAQRLGGGGGGYRSGLRKSVTQKMRSQFQEYKRGVSSSTDDHHNLLKNGGNRRRGPGRPPVHGSLFQPQAPSPTAKSSSSTSNSPFAVPSSSSSSSLSSSKASASDVSHRSLSKKKGYGTLNVSGPSGGTPRNLSAKSSRSRAQLEPSLTDPTGAHSKRTDMPSNADLEKAVQRGVFGVSAASSAAAPVAAPPLSRSSTSSKSKSKSSASGGGGRGSAGATSPSHSREPSKNGGGGGSGKNSLSRSTSRRLQFDLPSSSLSLSSSAPTPPVPTLPAQMASEVVRKRQEELQQRQEESRRNNGTKKMMKSRSPTRFLRRKLSPNGTNTGTGTGSQRSLTRNLPSHLVNSPPQRGSAPTPSITNNPPSSRSNSRSKRKKGGSKSSSKQSHMRARSPPVASLSDRLGRQRRRGQHKRSASSQMMLAFSQHKDATPPSHVELTSTTARKKVQFFDPSAAAAASSAAQHRLPPSSSSSQPPPPKEARPDTPLHRNKERVPPSLGDTRENYGGFSASATSLHSTLSSSSAHLNSEASTSSGTLLGSLPEEKGTDGHTSAAAGGVVGSDGVAIRCRSANFNTGPKSRSRSRERRSRRDQRHARRPKR